MLSQNFAKQNVASKLWGMSLREKHGDMMALQTHTIRLMKQQGNLDESQVEDADDAWLPDGGAAQATGADITVKVVPLPLALQGPAAAAWQLVSDASCTEEQIDAVALLALSMQKRFDARPDKTIILLPVATSGNNHRALWLGGGGVGKARTLNMIVQPLAEAFFGPDGFVQRHTPTRPPRTWAPRVAPCTPPTACSRTTPCRRRGCA